MLGTFVSIFMLHILTARHQGIPIVGSDVLAQETELNDGFAALPPPTWKGAGVAIPVFSLRSQRSFGIGEFPDLKLLVDWCGQTGLRLIQLLLYPQHRNSHGPDLVKYCISSHRSQIRGIIL